jgi:uncharacterized protein (DUF1015 family)
MADIQPFRALRPKKELANKVASRPYDVLNSEEARMEASGNPYSFLHITKSEIDLPEHTDPYSERVYHKAKDNLDIFRQEGILFQDESPCYYIYQLVMNDKSQTGLVTVSSLRDYDNNIIKKHELTRPEKEQDRINHIRSTGAQTGNVFLAYNAEQEIHQSIEDWKASHHPEYDFQAGDGILHRVWVVNDPATVNRLTELFRNLVPATYIADGHHRAASAAKLREALGDKKTGASEYFLTTLFPSDQLHILDYNRLVKDLAGLKEEDFLQMLDKDFTVEKSVQPVSPRAVHQFGMYLSGNWYLLTARPGSFSEDPIGILDVTILQKNILDAILGIKDPRTDKRIDFVGGIRGLLELQRRVDNGEMKVAFSLHPVTIRQLFDIADHGEVMPPKSTWFEPKLRDGLLTHLIS